MAGNTCDVCDRSPSVGVGCSGLGAISFAYCKECLEQNAEPSCMFEFLYETSPKLTDWHESVKAYKTYVDGSYVSLEDWWKKKTDGLEAVTT